MGRLHAGVLTACHEWICAAPSACRAAKWFLRHRPMGKDTHLCALWPPYCPLPHAPWFARCGANWPPGSNSHRTAADPRTFRSEPVDNHTAAASHRPTADTPSTVLSRPDSSPAPRQNQKPIVVDHQIQVLLMLFILPAHPFVSARQRLHHIREHQTA